MLNQTNNFQNSEFENSTAVDNNNAQIDKQINNFQNSENGPGQYFKNVKIGNQNNNFFSLNLDWIFKSFKNKDLSSKQFLFLLFSKSILFFLLVGLFLLPLFSVNKHNISFFEFAGMIVVFVFLCSWYWNKLYDAKIRQLASQN